MKLHIEDSPVYSSGSLQQQEFKISASAKAFKILSSNLYTNKIRAIIRELSTNALDAQKANGNYEKQFQVHLPSALDPVFWIRDFGIGLSQEQVLSLYTTYFESTKADSNDFVGALGLGSKSPFSYVDSFMVTSFFNGTKTMYDMSLKSGVPNVAVLAELPTDEPNGVMVSMSVMNTDIRRFHSEAPYVYKTFLVKPEFVGPGVEVDMQNVTQYEGYFTSSDSDYYRNLYALMGGIAYPISSQIARPRAIDIVASSNGMFVEFELGELDITPSREELSYDDETIKTITARLEEIEVRLISDLIEPYKDATGVRETYSKIQRNHHSAAKNIVLNNVKIDGKSILNWSSEYRWDNYAEVDGKSVKVKFKKFDHSASRNAVSFSTKGARWHSVSNLASIDLAEIYILKNDDGKSPMQTVRALFDNGTIPAGRVGYLFDYTTPESKQVLDNLLKHWKDSPGLHLFTNSELKKVRTDYVKNKVVAPSNKKTTNYQEILVKNGEIVYNNIKLSADDVRNYDGVYILKFDDYWCDFDKNSSYGVMATKAYMQANDIQSVLIVRSGHWKIIKENENAVWIQDAINETIANASGKMVALKSGSLKTKNILSWVTTLTAVDSLIAKKIGVSFEYKSVHPLVQLFEAVSCSSANKPEDTQKQINRFKGKLNAINKSVCSRIMKFEQKHPLIVTAISNANSSSVHRYLKDIRKILM